MLLLLVALVAFACQPGQTRRCSDPCLSLSLSLSLTLPLSVCLSVSPFVVVVLFVDVVVIAGVDRFCLPASRETRCCSEPW